ncbi:hypothetical protein MNV49_002421 [Pseudohyphozyma bogoriensis]|nr:hypothetical protein MNV49_002421 [Pseudohyphozyma bogoriensis]
MVTRLLARARANSSRYASTSARRLYSTVKIFEVGPRDGLQNEKQVIEESVKIELISRLVNGGLSVVESGSFVSPKWVPQMSSTAAVLSSPIIRELVTSHPHLSLPVLVPNPKGLSSLLSLLSSLPKPRPTSEIAIFVAASESFSRANINCSIAESLDRVAPVVQEAKEAGLKVRGYISVVAGCPFEGSVEASKVAEVAKALDEMGCYELSLGDTIGVATPNDWTKVLMEVQKHVPVQKLAAHCHDTFGTAIANVLHCVKLGIRTVDSSIAGLGGCPYSPGATGNVATEDVIYALESSSIHTGILSPPEPGAPWDDLLGDGKRAKEFAALAETGEWISGKLEYSAVPMSPTLSSADGPHELLLLDGERGSTNLALTEIGLSVVKRKAGPSSTLKILKPSSSSTKLIPYIQILSASSSPVSDGRARVTIAAVVRKSSGKTSKLWRVSGDVGAADKASRWCEELLTKAYAKEAPRRRLRVLVNPAGGPGKAVEIYKTICEPIFKAAGCIVERTDTGPINSPLNARNIARNLDLKAQDAVVALSGDGIIHELINGFAERPDALAALRTPLIPIPTGSGNALSVNLLGRERATDFAWAALAAVKGSPIPLDVCSVTQGGKTFYCFLSAAFGLMADLDLGTEHLRWMGDTRFIVGYIQGSLARRKYPVEMLVKIVETDKHAMVEKHNASLSHASPAVDNSPLESTAMPALRFGADDGALPEGTEVHEGRLPEHLSPGWHLLRTSVFFLYAGKMPYVAKDVKVFPVAGADGLLDIAMLEPVSRLEALSALDGSETDKVYWHPKLRYYKVESFRLTPLAPDGFVSIDGEPVGHSTFHMESHAGVARILSLDGWASENVKHRQVRIATQVAPASNLWQVTMNIPSINDFLSNPQHLTASAFTLGLVAITSFQYLLDATRAVAWLSSILVPKLDDLLRVPDQVFPGCEKDLEAARKPETGDLRRWDAPPPPSTGLQDREDPYNLVVLLNGFVFVHSLGAFGTLMSFSQRGAVGT